MYEHFFEMVNTPFVRNVPPELLYESPVLKDALGRLKYAANGKLFAVVTADAGCGKSTLIRRFASSLPNDQYVLLYVSDSQLTPRNLYKSLLDQLGMETHVTRGEAKRQLLDAVERIQTVKQKKVVCVLDEAHLLNKEILEEFRFLLNYHFDSESPMALILVGQTELWDNKLRYQRYAAIRQRIDINCVLPHLDRAETEKYIRSHLAYSGCRQDELFTEKALDEIYRASAGIPRMINRICEKCLMYAYQQQQKLIDDYTVRYVDEHEMLAGNDR